MNLRANLLFPPSGSATGCFGGFHAKRNTLAVRCYGTVKTLKVNYRLNGHPAEYTSTDPQTADLLEQE